MWQLWKKRLVACLAGAIILFSTGCSFPTSGISSSSSGGDSTIDPPQQVNISALTERNNVFKALSGQDALDRQIMPANEGNGKLVGVFYSLWMGNYYNLKGNPYFKNYNNVTEMLKTKEGREELFSVKASSDDTIEMYFSDEPLFGYYNNRDRWVVDNHVKMFISAGVDFLVIDVSNKSGKQDGNNDGKNFYKDALTVLLEVLGEYTNAGYNAPKVTFLTNTNSVERVTELYDFMYKQNLYKDAWFCDTDQGRNPNGKPWMVMPKADKSALGPEVASKFYFRDTIWPNGVKSDNGLPWISFETTQPVYNGIINVSVAQHPWGHMSDSVQYKISPNDIDYYNKNRGRGYNYTTGANSSAGLASGTNFETQWDNAIKSDARIAIITQWNEWAALKLFASVQGMEGKKAVWFDCFDFEFSRDIEPVNSEYGDNYYMQMVRNIRRFKGMTGAGVQVDNKTLTTNRITSDWSAVRSGVADFSGTANRDYTNALEKGANYTNDSKRNDIVEVRVASDSTKLYILVTTKHNLTVANDEDATWMNIWLRTEGVSGNPNGYDFVINRHRTSSMASVEMFTGKNPKLVTNIPYVISGKYIQFTLDKADMGIETGKPFRLKITDNVDLITKDVKTLYSYGDSAPYGRLDYSFVI